MMRKLDDQAWACLTLLLALLATALPAAAQGNAAAHTAPAATPEALFQAGEWEKSIVANEALVKAEPGNGRAWFRLGLSQVRLKRYEAAAGSFDRAEAAGYKTSPYLHYGRAAIAASRKRKDEAFAELEKAVTAGFADLTLVKNEENLRALSGDPRFQQLQLRIERPCEADPAYHKMDFWLGSWVAVADGKKDGNDSIEKILNGSALTENWDDVDGHHGKSLFYYNPATGKRKQVWVTDAGPLKEKMEVEAPEKGAVRFQGEISLRDGRTVLDRTTLTPLPGDRVHQVIEQSADGGKTWNVGYDAIYERPKP
jgi:tetratricopeptide (TPR) repeat protein